VRKRIGFGLGAVIAALLTHGFVYSGMRLSKPLSVFTYEGSFQRAILSLWHAWTDIHGQAPMTHADDFGRFMAHFVFFVCPVLSFAFYALVRQQRMNWQWWKPLAIAVAFATPLQQAIRHPLLSLGLNEPWAEAARAVVVFVLMVVSIHGFRIRSSWQTAAAKESLA
jgi:hypothetical protein